MIGRIGRRWAVALAGIFAALALAAPFATPALSAPLPEYLCYLKGGGLYRSLSGSSESTLVMPSAVPRSGTSFVPPFEIVDYSWAPSGTRLALLVRSSKTGEQRLFVCDQNGAGIVEVTDGAPGLGEMSAIKPSWSRDGSRFAYPPTAGLVPGVSVVDAITGRPLGQAPGFSAAMSPSGEEVAFAVPPAFGIPGIKVPSGDPAAPVLVVSKPRLQSPKDLRQIGRGVYPSWSPDGSEIAYWTWRGSTESTPTLSGIVVTTASTGKDRTTASLTSAFPGEAARFSPDGSAAFVKASAKGGAAGVYTFPVDGIASPLLVAQGASEYALENDGARIAYCNETAVMVARSSGQGTPEQVNAAGSGFRGVCISPGDRYVAYMENAAKGSRGPRIWVAVMGFGTKYTKVVATGATAPSWQPYYSPGGPQPPGTATGTSARKPFPCCPGPTVMATLAALGLFGLMWRRR